MKKAFFFVSVFIFLLAFTATSAEIQKIAVASDGKTPASQVSGVAARSPYFLVFDGKGNFVEALVNPHRNASGGAASRTVDFLSQKGMTVVIAGAFGGKMIDAMKDKGMKYLVFTGSAAQAVQTALK